MQEEAKRFQPYPQGGSGGAHDPSGGGGGGPINGSDQSKTSNDGEPPGTGPDQSSQPGPEKRESFY